MKLLTVTRE